MNKFRFIVALLLGLFLTVQAQEQEGMVIHDSLFKANVLAMPSIEWRYMSSDSLKGIQDTVSNVFKVAAAIEKGVYREWSYFAFYNGEDVYNGTLDKELFDDWSSWTEKGSNTEPWLMEYTEHFKDSLWKSDRLFIHEVNKDEYAQDGGAVTEHVVMLEKDIADSGEESILVAYFKVWKDSSLIGLSLYDKYELNEDRMFGVLESFDFSGEWLGYVDNVVYDQASLEPLSAYRIDSVLTVSFESTSDTAVLLMKDILEREDDRLYESGETRTRFITTEDTTISVVSEFFGPDWSDTAKLIWVDQDTLRYIIEVKQPALDDMNAQLDEGQGFAWIWNFCRQTPLKEEE